MAFDAVGEVVYLGVRVLAILAFSISAIIAATHWAVRKGSVSPFGAWPRFVRRWSDPLLKPVEVRLHRSGGNPQDAPTWLVVSAVVGGLILIGLTRWTLGLIADFVFAVKYPQGGGVGMLVNAVFNVLMGALMIRVIASFIQVSPHSRWMRPIRTLTDWILLPIQRILPNTGMLDFSPMVAWFGLSLLRGLILQSL